MPFNMMDLIDKYTPEYFEKSLIKKLEITSPPHPLNGWIRSYKKSLERYDFQAAQAICYQLLRLSQEINLIESHSSSLFSSLKRFVQQDNNYVGIRFEVSICSKLIEKEIPFRIGQTSKGESDFYLQEKTGKEDALILECAAFNSSKPRNVEDLLQKFKRKIVEKKFKSYASEKTFLLIDATNTLHHMINFLHGENQKKYDVLEILGDVTKEALKESAYGGVVLFTAHFDIRKYIHSRNWKKIYFEKHESKSKELLNLIFPDSPTSSRYYFKDSLLPKYG